MSDNRINPANADSKNPYADLGPHDPQPPVNAAPAAGPYPNPLTETPGQVTAPRVSPPSYPPQGSPANPWASPAAETWGGQTHASQTPVSQTRVPQTPVSQDPLPPNSAFPSSETASHWGQNVPYAGQPTQAMPRPKRRWVLALVVAIVALLIGFAMGESTAKQEAQAQIDDLWAENYNLRSELDDRASQIEALRQQLAGEADSSSSPSPADPYSLDPWWNFGSDAEGTEGFPGDGVYMVGIEIEAGTYATAGREGCVWTRVTGDFSVEDVSGTGESPTEVVIDPSDLAFLSTGCEDWVRVG